MKSQLNKKQIQELKESNQKLKKGANQKFKSRHKTEQEHLYFHQNVTDQPPTIKSRRKKS